jgi:hypothetical protein
LLVHSFAPSGLVPDLLPIPRLSPWAALFRRFAAGATYRLSSLRTASSRTGDSHSRTIPRRLHSFILRQGIFPRGAHPRRNALRQQECRPLARGPSTARLLASRSNHSAQDDKSHKIAISTAERFHISIIFHTLTTLICDMCCKW